MAIIRRVARQILLRLNVRLIPGLGSPIRPKALVLRTPAPSECRSQTSFVGVVMQPVGWFDWDLA